MTTPAREMNAEEARLYREVEQAEEARHIQLKRNVPKHTSLSWSHDNNEQKVVDDYGNEFLRLRFKESYEDSQGRTGWREVECTIPAVFRIVS
jgi:hypothetical protein